jgi:hypothetical protein
VFGSSIEGPVCCVIASRGDVGHFLATCVSVCYTRQMRNSIMCTVYTDPMGNGIYYCPVS